MDPDDMAAFLESWDEAEREAVSILQEALSEQRGVAPDPAALTAAADGLRTALAAGDPDAVWMRRAAGLRDDLTWGATGAAVHDEDLLLVCIGATVVFEDDPGLPDEAQASIMSLELVDWLGAIIGAVRAGPGSDAAAPALVAHIETCTEVEGEPLDEADAGSLEHAFELVLPAWEAAGVVDRDQCLTALGTWLLPRAAAYAWQASFDDDLDPGPAAGLAPRILFPAQQLVPLVRSTPIWRQIVGFLTYVSDRLPVTEAGNLKLSDARRLVGELDTGDAFDPTVAGRRQKTRSSAELAGLTRVVDLAKELGIVERHGSALVRVSARVAEVDSDPVAAWTKLMTRCLTDGILGQSSRRFSPWWTTELDAAVIDLLIGLEQVEGDVVPIDAIASVLLDRPPPDGREIDPFVAGWVIYDVHRLFERLAVLGAVAITWPDSHDRGDRDLDTHLIGAGVSGTPLATLLLHQVAGLPAHRIGELADGSARDLLDAVAELPDGAADAEVAAWAAQRPVAAVLEEVTEAARGDRVRAISALLVYDHLGAEVAAGAVERLADDEAAGTLARAWLVLEGIRPFEDAAGEEGRDAMIDVLATLIERDGPDAGNEALQLLGSTDDQVRFLEAVWRSPCPETLTVLTAVGDLHPDKKVRKAGRKAAFKRRSLT